MPKPLQTPETVGNEFGYLCPKCHNGHSLHVHASISVSLCPNGTEVDADDREWDDDSGACCGNCDWDGIVRNLETAPNFVAS